MLLPNDPAIQVTGLPELGTQALQRQAAGLLMHSVDREDRLYVLRAESKQGRHDALFLLLSLCLVPANLLQMPKLATEFRGEKKQPSASERAGTTQVSLINSPFPLQTGKHKFEQVEVTATWRRQKAR